VIDAATQRYISETLTLANLLGAIVFTYKGEDVVDTILHFAKEYRVGHIVIGRPGSLPLWRRLLGRKTLAERLILKAKDLTVVVVDAKAQAKPENHQSMQAAA
jgi:two-component system sensor histidine kinase KdpD